MMQSEEPKLKVVVNDEVIDLRNEVFDLEEYVPAPVNFAPVHPLRIGFDVPPFSKKLSGSEPTLQKKSKRRIPLPKDMPRVKHKDFTKFRDSDMSDMSSSRKETTPSSNNLTKLAENLTYNGPASFSSVSSSVAVPSKPTIIRNKPILRSKLPRTRAASADPRFRRTRSPSSRTHTLVTQSESRVSPANSERKHSSQSDSKFIVDRQNAEQRSSAPLPGPIGELQGDSLRGAHTKRQPVEDSVDEITDRTTSEKTIIEKDKTASDPSEDEEPSVITGSEGIVDPEIFQAPFIAEDVVKNVDVYNATMTKTVKLFDHADNQEEEFKPFWDDPRLLDKYGKLLKPVSIGPTKSVSSWTLPVETQASSLLVQQANIDYDHCEGCLVTREISDRRLLKRTCSKCTCTFERDSYVTDYSYNTIKYERTKENVFGLSVFFLFGSACGLLLVALVIWVLANDLIWMYLQRSAVPKFTGMTSWVAYYCGGVIYSITYVVKTVGYLFILPRNEVYEAGAKMVPQNEPWYAWLWPWT